jgi:hypothetical protein
MATKKKRGKKKKTEVGLGNTVHELHEYLTADLCRPIRTHQQTPNTHLNKQNLKKKKKAMQVWLQKKRKKEKKIKANCGWV